eukprot:COSAG06_NODE_7745_length_2391_cov_7.676702_2_plen_143_part_00
MSQTRSATHSSTCWDTAVFALGRSKSWRAALWHPAWLGDQACTRAHEGRELLDFRGELFELGEGKRGCKYSARQMHAETLRCFPSRYDTADLIAHKKKGTVPGLTRLERKLEDKFPEVKQAAARGVRARARPRRAREDHERV